MKKTLSLFAAMALFAFTANAQTKKDGTPDMRFSANKEAYGSSSLAPAPAPSSSAPAPSNSSGLYYGGGSHTDSHGGSYQGAVEGSSHKGGTYTNPNTNNQYGRHKSPY